jgi:hypothetical protein
LDSIGYFPDDQAYQAGTEYRAYDRSNSGEQQALAERLRNCRQDFNGQCQDFQLTRDLGLVGTVAWVILFRRGGTQPVGFDYAWVEIVGIGLLCRIIIFNGLPKFLSIPFISIIIIPAGLLMVHNDRLPLLLPTPHPIQ